MSAFQDLFHVSTISLFFATFRISCHQTHTMHDMPLLTTFILHPLPRPYHHPHPHPHQHQHQHQRLPPCCTALPPRRIAAVAKDLQQALQTSLQSRISRISITLPVGAKLGTEARPNDEHITQRQKAGDRELARILAAMFEGTGVKVRVIFEAPGDRNAASKLWGKRLECEIADLAERKGGRKRDKGSGGGGGGFGRTANGSDLQPDVDAYIVVGGSASYMNGVRRLAQEKGMDTLIIVANLDSEAARMPLDLQRFLHDEFVSVYHYEPNPHPRWKGGVLFRKFPDGKFVSLSFCEVKLRKAKSMTLCCSC